MKIRNGFVSNSSSSSFLINVFNLNMDKLSKIMNEEGPKQEYDGPDSWNKKLIGMDGECYLFASTSMDNYSYSELFEEMDISDSIIEWGDGWDDKPEDLKRDCRRLNSNNKPTSDANDDNIAKAIEIGREFSADENFMSILETIVMARDTLDGLSEKQSKVRL